MNDYRILQGDALAQLRTLPDASVHCAVTSPPYYGLRDYGADGQIGLEPTVEAYVARLVEVFGEVRRVLRDDGTFWLNLGDSYNGSGKGANADGSAGKAGNINQGSKGTQLGKFIKSNVQGLKPKDLIGVPWRVAFALQAAGWWLRADIIWAKKAPMPESVTDRPTRSHEDIFLLTKRERYYYDQVAVAEQSSTEVGKTWEERKAIGPSKGNPDRNDTKIAYAGTLGNGSSRNQRDVWTLSPESYSHAHFATFPTEIPRRAILAGTSERGCCPACGAPWERTVEKGETTNRTSKNGYGNGELAAGARFVDASATTTGWRPTCTCGAPDDWRADDLEVISSPTGERVADDPTMQTGRNGYNRPRGDNEGQRPITRYEQRLYAAQLRNSPMRSVMETEADSAFEHYIRTDRNGARPVPDALLDKWLACGWLESVTVPEWEPLPPIPCTVLDPFLGSGTTVAVAVGLGRHAIGIELNQDYISLAERRIRETQRPLL